MTYGNIWPNSRLDPRKARNEYHCETPACETVIHKGGTYYAEFRGGIDTIRRCATCAAKAKAAA